MVRVIGLFFVFGLLLANTSSAGCGIFATDQTQLNLESLLLSAKVENENSRRIRNYEKGLRRDLHRVNTLIELLKSIMGDRETPLNREIQAKIDEIDFLLRLGDHETIKEEIGPLFRETKLSYITVITDRNTVEQKLQRLEEIERTSGISLSFAYELKRGFFITEDPDTISVARTLIRISQEIQELHDNIQTNLRIFGLNYQTYQRVSSHLFHAGLGPNHESNKKPEDMAKEVESTTTTNRAKDEWWKNIRLDQVQFPSDPEVSRRFVTTAKIVLSNVGWEVEGSLFSGKRDINIDYLLKRQTGVTRELSDKYSNHPTEPHYDVLKKFKETEPIVRSAMREKVGRTGVRNAAKTVGYTFVWVAAKVAVLVARGNNWKGIRELGPRWVVALTKIFFAKYARYAYFHRIHQILKASSIEEQLDILRHHLGVTTPDLLVAFSMLKDKEPKEAWLNLRNYVDVRIKVEKNPIEQQRMVELATEMDKASKRGLGLGTLSFLGETSPFSAAVTIGTLGVINFFFPQIAETMMQADWSTLGLVGGGLTMAPAVVGNTIDSFRKAKENPFVSSFLRDLKSIVVELNDEGKLNKDADSTAVLRELETRLRQRDHNLEVMRDLVDDTFGINLHRLLDQSSSEIEINNN